MIRIQQAFQLVVTRRSLTAPVSSNACRLESLWLTFALLVSPAGDLSTTTEWEPESVFVAKNKRRPARTWIADTSTIKSQTNLFHTDSIVARNALLIFDEYLTGYSRSSFLFHTPLIGPASAMTNSTPSTRFFIETSVTFR